MIKVCSQKYFTTNLFGCSKKSTRQIVVKEIYALSTGNLPLANLSSESVLE